MRLPRPRRNASVMAGGQALCASVILVQLASRQTGTAPAAGALSPPGSTQTVSPPVAGVDNCRAAGQSMRRNPSASTTSIVGPVHFEARADGAGAKVASASARATAKQILAGVSVTN